MRDPAKLALLACFVLAACSGGPGSLGITGPGVHTVPPPEAVDSSTGAPVGAPGAGTSYGSSYGSSSGVTGFWGYNQ